MEENNQIAGILENFGIKDRKAAEVMGLSYAQFANKKGKRNYNKFTLENLESLKRFIKIEASRLK